MPRRASEPELLFEGSEWTFDALRRVHDAIDEVAREAALETYRQLYAHEAKVLEGVRDAPVREQLMALRDMLESPNMSPQQP